MRPRRCLIVVASLAAGEANGVRIQLCGRFAVALAGERLEGALTSRQARLLLAYLALSRSRPVERDSLVNLLWPDHPPSGADTTLRGLIFRLRQILGEGVLHGRSELVLDLPQGAWIDVEVARGAIHEAESALALERWKQAWLPARIADSISGMLFMQGHQGEWVDERRTELDELKLRALECIAKTGLALGDAETAAAERAGRALVDAAPFRESGYLYVMQALEQADNVAEALRVFETIRCLLRDELGISPSERLVGLHERLLARQSRPA